MFATLKQIFNSKNRDLLKRILFTLAALFVFKIGTSIIVPGIKYDPNGMKFLEILDAMSGGAFNKASIFALGVSPYITAQIAIQLLSADIVPYLSELKKQGGVGRKKINQITRVVGIALAFLQGYLYSYAYIGNGTAMDYMLYSLILTAGTALVMWIADQITVKGIGNGMSLIIMAGIISVLPNMFKKEYATINVSDLEKFEDGAVVTPELLKEMGIIKNQLAGIKVLGNGELTKKVTVKAAKFSKTAVEKIEKIGGKAEVI